ncbi:MAG: type II toxin-antitoxin system RelE/ParE family toxin [Deltaproteobacteria bacterium]|nr:type II toxin-antitoxin system RelE/ParE family toxin [Deltaproteobacteria bacterium]
MKFLLTFEAVRDLDEIHDFIALDNPEAALRFVDLLEEKIQMLAGHPKAGRERKELAPLVRGFPVGNYVIFYRESRDCLEVIRILHGARDFESLFEDSD